MSTYFFHVRSGVDEVILIYKSQSLLCEFIKQRQKTFILIHFSLFPRKHAIHLTNAIYKLFAIFELIRKLTLTPYFSRFYADKNAGDIFWRALLRLLDLVQNTPSAFLALHIFRSSSLASAPNLPVP